MLTPDQIAALRDAAGELTQPITDYLLQEIAMRISEAGRLTSTASYEIWKLQNLGVSQREIKKQLRKLLKVSHRQLRQLLTQSAEVGYRYDISRLPYVQAVPFEQNEVLQQMVAAAVKLAQDDLTNLVQTIGFVVPDGKAYPLTQAYKKACDFAFTQTFTGAADYHTAIRDACKKLSDLGIRTINYESGVSTSLEAAVRRNIMGGLGLMQEQITQRNHDDLGCDGWEISAHANSAPDHEPIQGKQYSDADYESLNNSLVRRIGTLNCGHFAAPILLGVSSPQYTPEELEKFRVDNKNGITYQGRHYTGYEATQVQRRLETAMRTQKRRILVDEAAGDKDKLLTDQIRFRRLSEEYKRFSKAAGLRTQPERVEVSGFGRGQAARATGAMRKMESAANVIFSLGSAEKNVGAYLRDKPLIDTLSTHGVKYKQRINDKEIIVDAGKPTISGMRAHAIDNLEHKADRSGMTQEQAQAFVDGVKLTLYRQDAETLKFMAQDGYAVLNFDHELVTSVPQKWRKKFDQYLEEANP